MGEKLIVVGGVAAGTKAASRAKRLNPGLDITIYTAEADISYAGCGLPYFVGDTVKSREELVVRSPREFEEQQGIKVVVKTVVEALDPCSKTLSIRSVETGEVSRVNYDKLILATGSVPIMPKIPGAGLQGFHQLRSVPDAEALKAKVKSGAKKAIVIGGGLIGLETAENLAGQGLDVSVLEREAAILSPFDEEVSAWVANYLTESGVKIVTGQTVEAIEAGAGPDSSVVTAVRTDKGRWDADIVLWAAGVRPNTALAAKAGVELGPRRGIKVDDRLRTNLPGIWACGDCCETRDVVTSDAAWAAMGSVANKMGRVAGTNVADVGFEETFDGIAGTVIVKLFDLTLGKTGLTEKEAMSRGYDTVAALVPSNDKAHYWPGHRTVYIKLVAERPTGRILGAQVWGEGVVDKPLDILATAISFGATACGIAKTDLAYAPPFSMAMGSVIVAANVLMNKLTGIVQGIGAPSLRERLKSGDLTVLDVRTEPEHIIAAIPGSINIPYDELNERLPEIPKDKPVVTVCKVGRRAYTAALLLKRQGFPEVKLLDGGTDAYPYEMI